MTMNCTEVREMLPAFAGQGEESLVLRRHLARCSECRAEARRYELLARDLGSLPGAVVEPPVSLVRALVAIPEQATKVAAVRDHVVRHRRRYAGGLAVALVGATGAAVLARRPRPA